MAVILCLWYAAVYWSGTTVFPTPMAVERGLMELIERGLLWQLHRGFVVPRRRRLRRGDGLCHSARAAARLVSGRGAAVNPVIQMLRPISPLAWIPLAIVWFGSDVAAIFLIFLASLFPVVVSTINGVRNVPPMFRQAGQNFGLSTPALIAPRDLSCVTAPDGGRAAYLARNCLAGGRGR